MHDFSPACVYTLPRLLTRGYTGHEHLDAFGLINMNGRLYDPVVGMFLSPDPYVQAPGCALNYNRYAYCLNNPLMYADPSGEFVFSLFLGPVGLILDNICWGAVIGGTLGGATSLITGGDFVNGFKSGLITGAISGFFGGLSPLLGNFGNSMGYGILKGTASQILTDNILGDKTFSAGDLGSSIVGGLLYGFGGVMESFKGVSGGYMKNAVAEIAHSTAEGAFVGYFGGLTKAAIDKDADAIWQGVLGGAVSGFSGAAFRVAALGATITNDDLEQRYTGTQEMIKKMDQEMHTDVSTNGVYRRHFIKGGGISIGRNMKIYQHPKNDRYTIEDFVLHERVHYHQQNRLGFAKFYGRYMLEFQFFGIGARPNTLEYEALMKSNGIYKIHMN